VVLQLALSHLGTHIADLRSPSILPAYGIEFRGWQTTLLAAVGAKTKTVMMPGGYVLFKQGWSSAELGKNANDGIAGFLENWAEMGNVGSEGRRRTVGQQVSGCYAAAPASVAVLIVC